ncbi:hypothetical protein MSIBF_A3460002 [groundwater metagenome]|uniref:Uncharacterized protein n=1 Tax=groundwater metagenome TaxID=717931 RepID=A0A098EDW8_9ZZZZ
MIGRIVNFRGGRRTHHTNQMVLELNDENFIKEGKFSTVDGQKGNLQSKNP